MNPLTLSVTVTGAVAFFGKPIDDGIGASRRHNGNE